MNKDRIVHTTFMGQIGGRQATIETQYYPDRTPPQTTFKVVGDFGGTHLEGGMGGVTITNDPGELIQELTEHAEDMMQNPIKPRIVTS